MKIFMVNEREIAVNILTEIFRNKAYNNIALREGLKTLPEGARKPFITELVNGTLRNVIHIDYIINLYSNTPSEKMKPLILNILRTAIYQIKFMDRIPPQAAVNEAVNLVKSKRFGNLSGFVNGVLRNILRNINNITYPDKNTNMLSYLSIYYSYPEWMLKQFLKEMDVGKVEEICKINNTPPQVSFCVNTLKTSPESLKTILEDDGVSVTEIKGNIIHVSNAQDIMRLNAYKNGLFHVMDMSSAACVDMLSPKSGEKMLDVCAAPGGKSFYSAYLMENKGKITSCDIYTHKVELIEKGAERLGIEIIQTEIRDATKDYVDEADCVLIDAPCSGLGLIRKKPDIKYTKTIEDIISLQRLQREILKASWKYVKPLGRMVYSTCTLSKEENDDNVEWFLEKYPFKLINKVNILPDKNTDGFFIALMERLEE